MTKSLEDVARDLGAADGRVLLAMGIYDAVITAKTVLLAHAGIHSLLSGMGYEGSTEKMADQLIADAVARKEERDKQCQRAVNALHDAAQRADERDEAERLLATARAELSEAEARLDLLDALEAAGVDNWAGYSEALKTLENADNK